MTPSATAGKPSMRNIHCQPAQPLMPAMSFMIQPDKGPPTMPATAIPDMKSAMIRGPHSRGVPVGEVQDDAGEEARFEQAKQEAR